LHIHTGPGHHERILINELKKHQLSFTFSTHFPQYNFGVTQSGENFRRLSGSRLYDEVYKWVWRLKRFTPGLRNTKKYQDITYPLYDYVTSKKLQECSLFFGWAQVSLFCLQAIQQNGGKSILEYPIAHVLTWQRYLQEESERFGIDLSKSFFSKRTVDRMLREIELANYISVPSAFVKNSFLEHGIAEDKLIVNPYGIDTSHFYPAENKLANKNKPYTVIAVGSVEIRKGFQYLLQAFDELGLPNAELKILGNVNPHFHTIAKKYAHNQAIQFLGGLDRENTAKAMRNADVMVMPSLVEGLSLVILETMASGTPVISSENTGAKDVIADGADGFVFPIRDVESLKEKLIWGAENRETLAEMGLAARKKILSHYTVTAYGERAVNTFKNFL